MSDDGLLLAAALCRRYAQNLPMRGRMSPFDVATECAAIIEDAAKLALTHPEIGVDACQEVWEQIS